MQRRSRLTNAAKQVAIALERIGVYSSVSETRFGADKSSAALGGALKDAVAKPLKTLSANPNGVQVGPGVGRTKGETFRLGSASVVVTEVLADKQLADLNGGH